MGVETPIPQKMIDPAAPEGAPPRRIKTVEKNICQFLWFGCEQDRFMLVSHENSYDTGKAASMQDEKVTPFSYSITLEDI